MGYHHFDVIAYSSRHGCANHVPTAKSRRKVERLSRPMTYLSYQHICLGETREVGPISNELAGRLVINQSCCFIFFAGSFILHQQVKNENHWNRAAVSKVTWDCAFPEVLLQSLTVVSKVHFWIRWFQFTKCRTRDTPWPWRIGYCYYCVQSSPMPLLCHRHCQYSANRQ